MTLIHMAIQQPARVEAMVLVGAPSYWPEQCRALCRQSNENGWWDWKVLRQRHVRDDDQIRALLDQFYNFKDSYDDMNFTPPYLSTITAQTLVVFGDRDAFFPVPISVEMYAAIPHAYLWIVPNGGHIPILDKHAAAFTQTASEFLRGEWETERATGAGRWATPVEYNRWRRPKVPGTYSRTGILRIDKDPKRMYDAPRTASSFARHKVSWTGQGGKSNVGGTSRRRTRRTGKVFARASVDTGRTYVSGVAVEAVVAQLFIDLLKQRCPEIPATEQALLEQLLFVGGTGHTTALLPADDHPRRRLRSWQPFYELELDVAQTYASRFFRDTRFYRVNDYPRLRPDDDVVLIGSQVANASARALLGRADQGEPVFDIAHGGWRAQLHWNLHTPESAPLTTIAEFRGQRTSLAHVFCERGSASCYESERDPAGTRYLDDYLLVTALPRRKGETQRALILSGLHGPGTRAIDLILREPPTAMLEKATHQIAGAPYYQMLVHLDTTPDERGECFPCQPELVEARALIIQ